MNFITVLVDSEYIHGKIKEKFGRWLKEYYLFAENWREGINYFKGWKKGNTEDITVIFEPYKISQYDV